MSTVEDIQKKFIEAVETITKMQNSQMTHLQIVKGKVVALDPIACYVKFSYNNHEYFGYSAISNFKIGEVILVLFDGSEDNNVVLCSVTSTVSGGKSISDLTMQYYLSNSNVKTDIPESDPGWVTTEPTPTTDKPYIWTRVIYVYSDGEVKNGEKALLNGVEVLADQIQKNKQLIIVLDNENQSISTDNNGKNGDYSNAKTSIKVYYGSEDVTSTSDISFVLTNVIGSYNSTSHIYTVINLTTDSGNVAITATYTPANLPTLTTTKIFSLSKARAGTDGTSGTSGKVANILATAQVFKSMDGGVTFTPDLITLTPSLQSVAFSKWQYSVDGGLTWIDAVTGAHGITISDNILTLSENSDLYTDTITAVVIKLTTDDSTVYDTETIVRLLDGAQGIQGPKGADGISPINLVIESSNGYQFKNNIINTTFTAKLYQDNKEIDKDGTQYAYVWSKVNSDGTVDTTWNLAHQTSQKSVTITNRDIWKRATFNCTAEPLN